MLVRFSLLKGSDAFYISEETVIYIEETTEELLAKQKMTRSVSTGILVGVGSSSLKVAVNLKCGIKVEKLLA